MGKAIRDIDPFVLGDDDRSQGPGKQPAPPLAAPQDPFILEKDDTEFVKKKVSGLGSGARPFPTPSGLLSDENLAKATQNYRDNKLSVADLDVLAESDWGKRQGLDLPKEWRSGFVDAHNGPKTSQLVNSVIGVLNDNYPRSAPGTPEAAKRDKIFSSVQAGDVPAIQTVTKSILDQKRQEIMKIENDPQGPEISSGVVGAPEYVSTTRRGLSDQQKAAVKKLEGDIESVQSTMNTFLAHAIVGKKENIQQLKAELNPQNTKFADLTLAAQSVGKELEGTVGLTKLTPNNQYNQTKAGLEAIMASYTMDINDLLAAGMKSKNPNLLQQAQDKIKDFAVIQARYDNLDNQYPDVGAFKTARFLGDILSEIKPKRLLTTADDVREAAAIAEQRNPGFLVSHGKFVDVVAKSEGDWIGVKSGLVPQGGVIGGIKSATENIGYGGAAFVASPFGKTWDPKTLSVIEQWQGEPQLQGTSAAGSQPTRVVYDNKNKVYREVANENYGNWDFNSTMYSLGKGIPTLAEWVVLDKGLGGALKGAASLGIKAANVVGKDIALTTNVLLGSKDALAGYEAFRLSPGFERAAGLYATTYITSFDENRKLAETLIDDKSSMGDAKKNALANFLTLSTAGIFSLMDYTPTKAIESALAKNAAPDVLKFFEEHNWENLPEEGTAKLLKTQIYNRVKAVLSAAGESAKAGAKLGAAGLVDQKIKDFTSLIVNPEKAKVSSLEDNAHAFADQVLLMTVLGLPNMVRSGAFPHSAKDALYQAGTLAPQYIERINTLAARGDLEQGKANEMIAAVKTMGEEVLKTRAATNDDGTPLTISQKKDLALSSFRKRAAERLQGMGVPIEADKVATESDQVIEGVKKQNKWQDIEKGEPFVTAREMETGKKLQSLDDLDPEKQYTYEQDGNTKTATGAELFNHIINGTYETIETPGATPESKKTEKPTTAEAEKGGTPAQGTPVEQTKGIKSEWLEKGKMAIENRISEGKLKGVYASLAQREPEAFLKEVADQAHGILGTGEKPRQQDTPEFRAAAEDADFQARENYGNDIVDAAKKLFPREERLRPIVARHGESAANAAGTKSTEQTPLTAKGEKQATALGERLKEEGYTDVLPSTMRRAEQTAEKVVEKTGGKIVDNPKLSELLKEWDQTGGEKIPDFARRIAQARDMIQDLPDGIAVIAHGKVMGMLEALDQADGDIEKAIEIFDKTKVYGNTDIYIPKQKTITDEEKVKLNEKRTDGSDKGISKNRPEGRSEGHGQPAAVGAEGSEHGDVGKATEAPNGEREEGDVLTGEGVAPAAAPPSREEVNSLLDTVTKFNKLRRSDPEKAKLLNDIRLKANELGLKVDYAKGFASITDKEGKDVQRRSEETNTTLAKDFDSTKYSDKTKAFVDDMVAQDLPLTGVSIPGFDGRIMSEAQKAKAIGDIRSGKITNGAKAIYDAVENMISEGFVELVDPASRQKIGVPIDDYIKQFREGLQPITDEGLTELNTLLGEDVFGKVFDDIFASIASPEYEPSEEIGAPEPAAPGTTTASAESTGGGEEGRGPGEPPKESAEALEAFPEPRVTGIRNVIVNAERMDRSLNPVVKEAATNFKEVWEAAKNLVKTGTVDPRSLVNALAAEAKPKVSDIDNALILMDRVDLTNQRIDVLNAIEKAKEANDELALAGLSQQLMDVDQKITQNDEVSDKVGQETARALSSRRMLATLDYTLSRMTADIRRFYPGGEVPGPMMEQLKKIEQQHTELQRKYEAREEEWKRMQAERVFEEEKAKVKGKEKPEKKIALKGKDLADKIRALRPKGGDTAQANIFGLPIAVYDTALVTIANLVEGGAKLADAIVEGLKEVAFPSEKDRIDFIAHINGAAGEEVDPKVNLVNQIVYNAKEQESDGIVKDSITPLRKLASQYIREGVENLDDLVAAIHKDLSAELPNISPREIRDAFSGYGNVRLETKNDLARQVKELQKQAVLISQLEDAVRGMQPSRGQKVTKEPSKKVRDLTQQLEKAMRDNGMTWEQPPRTPEQQSQRALQAAKTRLKSQIDILNRRLAGEPPPAKAPPVWDEERRALTAQRDALQGLLRESEGKSKLTDAMRVQRLENSLRREIAKYEEKIKEGGGPIREKLAPISSPEIELLKKRRDALKELNDALQVDKDPKSSPQQIALQAYKDRVKNRIETLTTRVREGDFETKERETLDKDAEAMRLDIELKRTESKFYNLKNEAEKANRPRIQKIFDKIAAYKRFAVLSGLPSMGKIALAVAYRTIGTPAEELVGAGLRHIPGIKKVAEQAPREGAGFSLKAEGDALKEWARAETYKDWLQVVRTGKGQLDIMMGKYAAEKAEPLEIFGRIHASLKNFSKRAEFARSFTTRIEYARKKGFDVSDEAVRLTAAVDAYTDAGRSIFMQDNFLTNQYFKMLKLAERDTSSLLPKMGAFLARFTMPVVKVPTNFIIETGTFAFGAFTGVGQILYKALRGELTKLSPEEADMIMRSLKKGSIGLTLAVAGYLMPNLAGGYYQQGEKRKADDLDFGELQFMGMRIPRWAGHFPALEAMQMGSTLRRIYDREAIEKGQPPSKAAMKSITGAAGGMLGEVPLFEQPSRMFTDIKKGNWDKLLGEEFKSLNPQLIQNVAAWGDREDGKTVKRSTDNPWEMFESGIPGLRQELPRKDENQ